MIVFKPKASQMLDRLSQKLDSENIEDYEVVDDIPDNHVSISSELNGTEIYLPERYEYSQYDIDDFIRSLGAGLRTSTTIDRDMTVLKVKSRLTEQQYFKLIKFIINTEDFCSIVE